MMAKLLASLNDVLQKKELPPTVSQDLVAAWKEYAALIKGICCSGTFQSHLGEFDKLVLHQLQASVDNQAKALAQNIKTNLNTSLISTANQPADLFCQDDCKSLRLLATSDVLTKEKQSEYAQLASNANLFFAVAGAGLAYKQALVKMKFQTKDKATQTGLRYFYTFKQNTLTISKTTAVEFAKNLMFWSSDPTLTAAATTVITDMLVSAVTWVGDLDLGYFSCCVALVRCFCCSCLVWLSTWVISRLLNSFGYRLILRIASLLVQCIYKSFDGKAV
jgi:hypothetical protein